ncbi:hypothetical protein P8605_00090 [Streptomyces sp. T-3]|nr:hypothetical protein [Streptomyces sp. T-3]
MERRSRESFPWYHLTRVFTVADPRTYRHYRMVLDDAAVLAEVELLG